MALESSQVFDKELALVPNNGGRIKDQPGKAVILHKLNFVQKSRARTTIQFASRPVV